MPLLRQLLSNSTGLIITYVGFALYALHTLAKYFLPPPDSPSVLSMLLLALGIAGSVGLIAAVLSMIVTGVRGARRSGWRSWWTVWAILGLTPFVLVVIAMASFSVVAKEGAKTLLEFNKDDVARVDLLRKKVIELQSKNAKPELISKVSRMYAGDAYLYKGEIVDYVDEAGKSVPYKPTDKEVQRRSERKEMPQKLEEAQHGRSLEIALIVAVPLLTVLAAFFTPMRRPGEPTR